MRTEVSQVLVTIRPGTQTLRRLISLSGVQRRRVRWTPGFERDAVLSGVLLYGTLAFAMATVYVLVIVLTSPPYGAPRQEISPLWWQNLLALVLIALIIAPLYNPLRRAVSQVVYGQHDDPYAIIARLNQRLEARQPPQTILASTAETIASTLKLAYVSIEAHSGTQSLAAAYGVQPKGSDIIPIPLAYQGVPIGMLRVTPRAKGAAFHGVDLRLLNELARQVSIVLYASQITAELQASRQSIITAREEERRRIRRDLHDGLGPVLSSLQLQLAALRTLVRQDPDGAEALAAELRDEMRGATGEIRRLVYDLRPPMLDEFGLAGAIRNLGASVPNLSLTVQTPEPMPALSAAQEVALYRIAMEAVHNVIKHSRADICSVELEASEYELVLSVSDNGIGLPAGRAEGIGFASMRERAGELGGSVSVISSPAQGTCVTARIPYNRKSQKRGNGHE